MAHQFSVEPNGVRSPKIRLNSNIYIDPLYQDRGFLTEKYVEKGWSARQIARHCGSGHQTVLTYLRRFGLVEKVKKKKVARKRGSGLAYGWKVLNNQVIPHKQEQERIEKMVELRQQGFSYKRIADIFNSMGIPTKTRKAKWHSTTIINILKQRNKSE